MRRESRLPDRPENWRNLEKGQSELLLPPLAALLSPEFPAYNPSSIPQAPRETSQTSSTVMNVCSNNVSYETSMNTSHNRDSAKNESEKL